MLLKSLLFILISPFVFFHSSSYAEGTLIAHYKFDVCDLTNLATDSVGGYHGIVSGNVTSDTTATSGLKPETCSSVKIIGGAIDVYDLPLSTNSGNKTSVSFWMYWDGTNNVMPMGFQFHDLWFNSGSFGFNSFNSDIYGISSNNLALGWHHVTAIFTNNNITDNKLYINGVEQTLTQRRSFPNNNRAVVNSHLRISGVWGNSGYRFSGNIDELKVYDGEVSQSQVNTDYAYFVETCPTCIPPEPESTELIAEYTFNNEWNISGNLIDSINNNNGVRSGTITRVTSLAEGNKPDTCYAGQFNGGTFDIANLPVSTATNDITTVSFWMKWDGTNSVMPIGWNFHDLWFFNNSFGFNSARGDIYGISSSSLANEWHYVTAVFHNHNLTKNKLYIDGVEQNLTQRRSSPNNSRALVDSRFRISGWRANNSYRFRGELDELKIYNGELTPSQILDDMNADCSEVFAKWTFDQSSWNGIDNDVLDSSDNAFHSIALNGADTSRSNPAIVSDISEIGTCQYGEFDGINDYIEVPSTFENLQTSFTISAWINPKNLDRGSRIFADDQNNQRGYAFSLGDPGSGKLRFYSRGVNPISVDTLSAVIATDEWTFVTAVHNSENKTRQIYVNGVAQRVTGGDDINTYSGTWGIDNGPASIGGETDSGETNNRFTGAIDEVNIFKKVLTADEINTLMAETRPCTSTSPYIDIDINGDTGSTCVAKPIKIRACQDAACNNLMSNYTGEVTLSTSRNHGDWSASATSQGTINNTTSDDGAATYTFDSADNGVVELDFSNTHAETITFSAIDNASGESDTSEEITFSDNTFVFDYGLEPESDITSIHVAGRNELMNIALYRRDVDVCGINTNYQGNKAVKISLNRDIALDPNGNAPKINSISIPEEPSTVFNLAFTAGVATFNLTTDDVGKYEVDIVDDTGLFSDQDITGQSETIVTRPFAFDINIADNPGASDADGDAFLAAGETFQVTVRAVAWDSEDDTNNDGQPNVIPDDDPGTNNDLSNNFTVESFETSLTLTGYEVLPNLGSTNILENGSEFCTQCQINNFNLGEGTSGNIYYDNVGIIEIEAELNDYLGSGHNIYGQSSYVGRFIPDRFEIKNDAENGSDIVDGSLQASTNNTNSFVYTGQLTSDGTGEIIYNLQPNFTIQAKSAIGTITSNYTGDFYKLTPASITRELPTADSEQNGLNGNKVAIEAVLEDLSLRQSADDITITFNENDHFIYTREANSLIAPFQAEIPLTICSIIDSDGVETIPLIPNEEESEDEEQDTCNLLTLKPTGLYIHFGRWFINNTFGPETSNLPMPMAIQHWNGTNFITNQLDNTTSFDADNNDNITISNNDLSIGANDVTGNGLFTNGMSQDLIILAPNALPNRGSISIEYSVPAWLQFDWNAEDGTYDDNPDGQATFGLFRGNDRIINWREISR